MIRNIIFDMGEVLIHWTPDWVLSYLHLSDEDNALLKREAFNSAAWVGTDRGILPTEELIARMCRHLPARLHGAVRACVNDWWKHPLYPMEGMESLIRELKQNGYGLYILSNASRDLHAYFSRLPAADAFDGYLVSADWGVIKPERAIYEKLFDTFTLNPAECFFIDDSRLNIEGAEQVGMGGTVFSGDVNRLRADLIEAGVNVSPTVE